MTSGQRRRVWLAVVAVLVIGAVAVVASMVLRPADTARTVRVGLYENAPKIYTGRDGTAQGLFPEVLAEIARNENWRVEWVPCEFSDCLTRLSQGELDLMPDVAFTAERDESLDFHDLSVANSWSQIYTRPDLQVGDLSDLAGLRIALLKGGVQEDFLDDLAAQQGLEFTKVPVPTLADGYQAVVDGKADAVVTNSFFAAYNGSKYKLRESPIVFLPSTLYFAAPAGGEADLLQAIDENLATMKRDPNSVYYSAVRQAVSGPPTLGLPGWVVWSVVVPLTLALLIAGVALLLRRQVRVRTAELELATEQLQEQRDNLEVLVDARTAELRAAKDEAERLTHVKSDFLANMSHEIRTPMNAVMGMLYLALKTDIPDSLRLQLTKAQNAAQSLLGVINDILDVSKIESGKLHLERTEFRLDTVLEQVTDAVAFQAEAKGIEFLIRYDPDLPRTVVGDPLRLGQVLTNLCGNAVKFTDAGQVELVLQSADLADDSIVLQATVRDSGIGISEADQKRMFEAFSQADQSTTRRYGGTGLGLPISRSLVELMGGRIWIEESTPGRGTTISFTTPLGVPPGTQAPRRDLMEQAGPLLQGVRILIVDDNEVSREILAEMLGYFRVNAESATSGPEAIRRLESTDRPFDVVLMDWRMPAMTGDEVVRRIHASPAVRHQPRVIMVTAHGGEQVVRSSQEAGIDGFLVKPVTPSMLLEAILSTLGRERLQAEQAILPAPVAPTAHRHLAGARILLVEDNEINREFAAEFLRSEGVDVTQAVDGGAAVELVQEQDFDAVLMDIQMPVLDGYAATRRIRQLGSGGPDDRYARLPIIAMTALAMAEDVDRTVAAGMNAHVVKPIDPDRLLVVLDQWVGARQGSGVPLPPGPTAGEVPADLLRMTTVDAVAGVRRIGGQPQAYRKQLRRFRSHFAHGVDDIRQAADRRDLILAEERCHVLKGVAGNIAAVDLHQCLEQIDGELKAGRTPADDRLDTAQAMLSALLGEIDELPDHPDSSEDPVPRLTADEVRDLVGQLTQALQFDLGAAQPLLDRLLVGCAGTPLAAEFAAVEAMVEVFDIDSALSRLGRLDPEAWEDAL